MADIDRNNVLTFVRALVSLEGNGGSEPETRHGYIKVLLGRTWRIARGGGTRARCDWESGQDEDQLTDQIIRMVTGEIEAEKGPGKVWVHAYLSGESSPCRTLSPVAYEPGEADIDLPDTQGEALLRVTMELLKSNLTLTKDVRTMSRDQMELAYKLGEASAEARAGADAAQWEAMASATPHFLGLAERLMNQAAPADGPEQEDGKQADPCPADAVGAWDWRYKRIEAHVAAMYMILARRELSEAQGKERLTQLKVKVKDILRGLEQVTEA